LGKFPKEKNEKRAILGVGKREKRAGHHVSKTALSKRRSKKGNLLKERGGKRAQRKGSSVLKKKKRKRKKATKKERVNYEEGGKKGKTW